MLKIWGRANSSNVMKVLWLCDELGIAHERIDAGGAFGKTREPFYLAMNPNSRVPTIEEPDGYSLWESHSILRYLVATRAPGHAVHPTEPRARGNVERWMDWLLAALNPPYMGLFREAKKPAAERAATWAADAKDMAAQLSVLDGAMGKPWIAGASMSLADIALAPIVHRCLGFPIDLPKLETLRAWHGRVSERPAFKTAAV